MRLILIRHGETLWNETHRFQGISDIPLSSKGIEQAKSLAESLKRESPSAIYTSPLIRARQTAEEIACYHDCEFSVQEGLKELNQGQLEGLTAKELKVRFPEFLSRWIADPEGTCLPGGESLGDVQKRAWAVIEKIIQSDSDDCVIAVAHSFVNLTVLCRVLRLPLNYFRSFRQDACGKNIVEFSERGVILRCLNDTGHLIQT